MTNEKFTANGNIVRQQAVKKKHQIMLIIRLCMAELFFFHYDRKEEVFKSFE